MAFTVPKLDQDWTKEVRKGLDAVGETPKDPDAYDVLSDDSFTFGADDPDSFGTPGNY